MELEQTVFSESSYFDGMNKSERMCKSLPRWGRVLGTKKYDNLTTKIQFLLFVNIRQKQFQVKYIWLITAVYKYTTYLILLSDEQTVFKIFCLGIAGNY